MILKIVSLSSEIFRSNVCKLSDVKIVVRKKY